MKELRLYKLIERACVEKYFGGSDLYVCVKLAYIPYFLKEIKDIVGAELNFSAEKLELYLTDTSLQINLTELIAYSAMEDKLREIFADE